MNPALPSTSIVLDPVLPIPVVAMIAAALLFFTINVYLRVGTVIEHWRNILLLGFRMVGIALVVALLLRPSRQETLPPPTKERVTLVAVDSSLSMKQCDVGRLARLDAAKHLLVDSGAVGRNGLPGSARARLFEFSRDAQPLTGSVLDLVAKGDSTRFHQSVTTMLNTPGAGEVINALILLSDGHDFELVNPVKTGAAARTRQTPIYAVAFGKQGKVRDVAARITGFQPYCYVKQKSRVAAALRLIGCEYETLNVQLLRHGQVVQIKRVNAEELQELPVEFEVVEPEVGQYEYEVRVQPLLDEVDAANNSAITYLNVIDQQIHVLILEGDPYWDTTFLQRSLMRNDKFVVDALVRYSQDRVRAIRKTPAPGELRVPETLDQLSTYDVVILGQSVERLLSASQIAMLDQFVKDRSGVVIFSRGQAFENSQALSELEPVLWSEQKRDRVRVQATSEGRSLEAFRMLSDRSGVVDGLPDLLNARKATETKPLTATLAQSASRDDLTPAPAIVHRRYGRGQVISVGVEGLWRWGLNSKVEGVNAPFDRFWDQMILWLLAGRDFIPNRQYSFRPSSANVMLGEKAYFRLTMRQPDPKVVSIPVTLYWGDKEVARANMTASGGDAGRLVAEFLPERVGRYRAVARFPDGTAQESRFIVFTENLEETEVATDVVALRRLCESSGGKLIPADELARLLQELSSEKADVTPKTRLCPIWNASWVFYLTGLLFGLDWFFRRRWGLC